MPLRNVTARRLSNESLDRAIPCAGFAQSVCPTSTEQPVGGETFPVRYHASGHECPSPWPNLPDIGQTVRTNV